MGKRYALFVDRTWWSEYLSSMAREGLDDLRRVGLLGNVTGMSFLCDIGGQVSNMVLRTHSVFAPCGSV